MHAYIQSGCTSTSACASESPSNFTLLGRFMSSRDGGGRSIRVVAGNGTVEASAVTDSTRLYTARDSSGLRTRLESDGYLFLKGVLDTGAVLKAYQLLLEDLHRRNPACVASDGRWISEGQEERFCGLLSQQHLALSSDVRAILESTALAELAGLLLQEQQIKTTNFKWLRSVPPGQFTGLHTDRVFLGGGGSERLLTIWIPFHSVQPQSGSLLICRGSHRSRGFAGLRRSYGASRVGADGTRSGWLTDDGGRLAGLLGPGRSGWVDWRAATFETGDVAVLHQDVLHMTAANGGSRLRVSCDTRWQPAQDPANPRLGEWTVYGAAEGSDREQAMPH